MSALDYFTAIDVDDDVTEILEQHHHATTAGSSSQHHRHLHHHHRSAPPPVVPSTPASGITASTLLSQIMQQQQQQQAHHHHHRHRHRHHHMHQQQQEQSAAAAHASAHRLAASNLVDGLMNGGSDDWNAAATGGMDHLFETDAVLGPLGGAVGSPDDHPAVGSGTAAAAAAADRGVTRTRRLRPPWSVPALTIIITGSISIIICPPPQPLPPWRTSRRPTGTAGPPAQGGVAPLHSPAAVTHRSALAFGYPPLPTPIAPAPTALTAAASNALGATTDARNAPLFGYWLQHGDSASSSGDARHGAAVASWTNHPMPPPPSSVPQFPSYGPLAALPSVHSMHGGTAPPGGNPLARLTDRRLATNQSYLERLLSSTPVPVHRPASSSAGRSANTAASSVLESRSELADGTARGAGAFA
eukprot:CAMPEP_0181108646 /NCGR_PEP_ID=MMETSP1071-20121207/17740_1 /TAXON_ID=35127 /ORGANISM="Thalassiosira sp., Strain NH16" /LENGTH=415 /DNA_ID=CAMNT_0023192261 /DNA_START=261 /DNA_END=1505 /DNA_ORIENTATION=+